ncbi:MAG: hypothetical protein PUE73_02630 [Eubacteriales bacterium]|nr:hypothetical protein [Eubacteriales bacterium]
MTKKFMKKVVALFLTVVMVVSSVPFVATAAVAADDPLITSAEEAMNRYDERMDGTVYTNMLAAYEAYVKLNGMIDRYKYIGSSTGITEQITALNNATNSMTPWQSYKGSKYGKSAADTTKITEADYLKTYVNILYATDFQDAKEYQMGTTGQIKYDESGSSYNSFEGIIHYSPNAVMLYDGDTTPMIPVCSYWYGEKKGTGWKVNMTELSCYLFGAKNGMELDATWKGTGGTLDLQWLLLSGSTTFNMSTVEGSYSNAHNTSKSGLGTQYAKTYYGNELKFTGSMASTEGYRTVYPSFGFYSCRGTSSSDYNSYKTGTAACTTPIYVLNYKKLLDAMKGCEGTFQNIANYSHGGALQLMQAIDAATTFNPTTYDYSGNETAVSDVADVITARTDAITTAKTADVLKADNSKYDALGDAIAQSKSTMLRGNADGSYEAQSWQNFADAYNEAVTIVSNIPVSPYYSDADRAETAAAALTTAKANLKTVGKVETADLEISLSNLSVAVANRGMFTAASYSAANLESIESTVKNAVWGSVANYGVDAEKIADTEANRTSVAEYTTQVNNAIAKLRIDVAAVVTSAGKSMEAAINDSAQYIAQASEYANIAVLQEAVAAANNFIANENVAIDASIAGTVLAQVNKYQTLVKNITNAIRFLRPSFSKTTDGTMVTAGVEVENNMKHAHSDSNDKWRLHWYHNTGTIIFRTTHDEVTYDLPDSRMDYANGATKYDSLWDSFSLLSTEAEAVPEITSSKTQSGAMLSTAQREKYNGVLSAYGGGIDYAITSIKLNNIGGATNGYGRDVQGNLITDLNYDWVDTLRTCEGGNDGNENWLFAGGPVVKNGINSFTVKSTAHMEPTTNELTATTKPTLSTFSASQGALKMSMSYYWAYEPTIFQEYYGYGYNTVGYNLDVHIIDITTLLDLVAECEQVVAQGGNTYTTTSWNAFTTALSAAKAEFTNIENLDAVTIKNGCVERYTNLWAARKGLAACASNANLKNAVSTYKDIYDNDAAKCETQSFAAFRTAYQAAASKYAGDYSDTKFRDYAKGGAEEQDANALATALNEAYAALKYYADFTALDAAAANLATGIADRKYSAKTLQALADALASKPYLSMDQVTRKTVYKTGDDATNEQDDIDREKDEIVALADTLADSVCNTEVLEAAKAEIKAKADDPDAYSGIDSAIQNLGDKWYTSVNIYGSISKEGSVFDTVEEVDAEVTRILQYDITPQMYQVKVDGEAYNDGSHPNGMYQYGETVIVNSGAGKPVNWKYSHVSNTTTCAQKYFATAEDVEFVVKGNTDLVTSTVKDLNTNQIKVTFKNRLNGMTYDYMYVTKGGDYTLPNTAPACANFRFDGYTNASGASVTSVPTTEDITVYANYVYDAVGTYTVNIAGMINRPTESSNYVKISNLNYNDEISLIETDISTTTFGGDAVIHIDTTSDNVTVQYHINNNSTIAGEEVDGTISGAKGDVVIPGGSRVITTAQSNPGTAAHGNAGVGGYIRFASNADYNTFVTTSANAVPFTKLANLVTAGTIQQVKVASFGTDYTFRVHESMDIMPVAPTHLLGYTTSTADTGLYSAASLYAKGVLEDFAPAVDDAGKGTVAAARGAMHPVLNLKSDIVVATGKFSMIADYTLPEGFESVESGILFCSDGTATAPDVNLTLANVGTNGIKRLKSTRHTKANQYVVSINNGTKTGDVGVTYAAYLIYKDASGNMQSMVTAKNTNVVTLK